MYLYKCTNFLNFKLILQQKIKINKSASSDIVEKGFFLKHFIKQGEFDQIN